MRYLFSLAGFAQFQVDATLSDLVCMVSGWRLIIGDNSTAVEYASLPVNFEHSVKCEIDGLTRFDSCGG